MMSLAGKMRHYGLKRSLSYILGELKVRIVNRMFLGSYSQSTEDLVLDKLIGYKRTGFYVDVGAYDPVWLSNTMRFYRRGWRGINIEPNPVQWKKFKESRPHDTNLNLGVGPRSGTLTYYSVDPPTLSTFSGHVAQNYVRSGLQILSSDKIPVQPLSKIFSKYAAGRRIDFMSLDVEGFEMDVLKSNDWQLYRPDFLCVETASEDGDKKKTKTIKTVLHTYLSGIGYTLVSDNGLNSFYANTERSMTSIQKKRIRIKLLS